MALKRKTFAKAILDLLSFLEPTIHALNEQAQVVHSELRQMARVISSCCEDVGTVMAASIYVWFRDETNLYLLERLRTAGLTLAHETVEPTSDKLAGTTWVITGTLSRPREEMAELIRSHGGKVSGSVSKKTSYLLAGDEAGSKLDKAQHLNIPVVDETGFHALLTPH